MGRILLPIKPQYAHAIIEGRKTVEYRKVRPKDNNGVVIIYSSSPECKVIGEFSYDGILALPPEELWNSTHDRGCIEKKDYDKYYNGKTIGYAFNIVSSTVYDEPKILADYGIERAPQLWVRV